MKASLFIICALLLPMWLVMERNAGILDGVEMITSSLGIMLVLVSLFHLLKGIAGSDSKLISGGIALLLLSAFLIRFLFGFLYDFSGRGFSSEFFAHINITSLRVAWDEYQSELLVLLVLALLVFGCSFWLIRRANSLSLRVSSLALLVGFGLLGLGLKASPEWQFYDAYTRYHQQNDEVSQASKLVVRQQALEVLQPLRQTGPLPVEKANLQASLPARPINLVMVYLESFNRMLTDNPQFPGLTPRINGLKNKYHHYSQIHSSGYVTIEGIANSHCGTLMNMQYANNSLMTRKGRLPDLPCLGDILREAGYQQTFLGGAPTEFAGKGDFLREHGYDRVLGWEHWQPQGYEKISVWGLDDVTLFDQALKLIKQQQQTNLPFNVTLLTIGTHTPGFSFKGCPQYKGGNGDPFLNAVHCTDHLFGRFVDQLEQAGVLENTLLFAQGDHGVFTRSSMQRLFGDAIEDRQLLTLMMLPTQVENRITDLKKDQTGTNLDTVATLLDMLQVKHNTGFIMSRPHHAERGNKPYYLTRYNDYYDGQVIENTGDLCADNNSLSLPGNLPLDRCGKSKVMKALSALNVTYADVDVLDNRVCDLGVKINTPKGSDRLDLVWGNQRLSKQFNWRGNKKGKFKARGVFAIAADEVANVEQALFFMGNPANEQAQLDGLLQVNRGERQVLLVRTLDFDSLEPEAQKMWPAVLARQEIVYGVVTSKGFEPILGRDTLADKNRLIPASCNGGAKWVDQTL